MGYPPKLIHNDQPTEAKNWIKRYQYQSIFRQAKYSISMPNKKNETEKTTCDFFNTLNK